MPTCRSCASRARGRRAYAYEPRGLESRGEREPDSRRAARGRGATSTSSAPSRSISARPQPRRVRAREPARARARRGVLRLAARRAGPEPVVGGALRGVFRRRDGASCRPRSWSAPCARRPCARAPGRLPAGAPGARRGDPVAGASRLLPRLGEPQVDGLHEPRALVFERNGEALLAPLEGDVMRWTRRLRRASRARAADRIRARHELADAARGGRAARAGEVPGRAAELMFAPAEEPAVRGRPVAQRALPAQRARAANRAQARSRTPTRSCARSPTASRGSPITATSAPRRRVTCSPTCRRRAGRRCCARRWRSRSAPDERRSSSSASRCAAARMARSACTARSAISCELFLQHLPGQRTRVPGYDDTLTTEQVGGDGADGDARGGLAARLLPRPHAVGLAPAGPLQPARGIGQRPQRDDPERRRARLGQDDARPEAQVRGLPARRAGDRLRPQGRPPLPPPRGGRAARRERHPAAGPVRCAACSTRCAWRPRTCARTPRCRFCATCFPARAEPAWETAVVGRRRSGHRAARATPTCLEVVQRAGRGRRDRRAGRKTLEVYARSGLTQLGFADPDVRLPAVGHRQVTYLPIRDLPGPEPGTPRSEYSQAERIGEQIVRLIAMFAMHLMSAERERLKLFSFDEGWRLLGDPAGRALLASLQRMGRSELAVPIISTQLVSDALLGERESLENLLGATFVFGMRSESEAARALSLLGLDPDDQADAPVGCSSSRPAAACFATTAGASRRYRWTSWCRRCCARSRQRRRPECGAARTPRRRCDGRGGDRLARRVTGRAARGPVRRAAAALALAVAAALAPRRRRLRRAPSAPRARRRRRRWRRARPPLTSADRRRSAGGGRGSRSALARRRQNWIRW